MAGDTRIVLREREIATLIRDPGLAQLLLDAAVPVVAEAQQRAPRLTGRGARSIRAEAILDGPEWTARISWDQLAFYMYFQETGTSRMPAQPFLVPALEDQSR